MCTFKALFVFFDNGVRKNYFVKTMTYCCIYLILTTVIRRLLMCYETCCYEKMNDWCTRYFLTPIYKMLKENGFIFREFIILYLILINCMISSYKRYCV